MSDLISRQAAIDAMAELQGRASTKAELKGISKAWKRIKQFPSVQPDIVRCKDCKYFEYDHLYVVQDIPVIGHLVCNKWGDGCRTDENGFCFMGARRTDG